MTATVPHTESIHLTESDVGSVVAHIRAGFNQGTTRPLEWRRAQLDSMEQMLRDGEEQLAQALKSDLGKSPTEAWTTEIGFVLSDLAHTRKHLTKWAKPRKVSVPLVFRPVHRDTSRSVTIFHIRQP